MFKNLGKLKYLNKKKEIRISLNELKEGINLFDNFIVYKNNNNIKIYNRKCDHAGGKIISKNGNFICPNHMWKFNPSKGTYDNGIKKKKLNIQLIRTLLKLNDISYTPQIQKVEKKLNTKIRFLNHAFLKISGDNFFFLN